MCNASSRMGTNSSCRTPEDKSPAQILSTAVSTACVQVHGAAVAALSLNLYFSAMHGVAEFLLTVTPPPHAASAKAVSWVLLVVEFSTTKTKKPALQNANPTLPLPNLLREQLTVKHVQLQQFQVKRAHKERWMLLLKTNSTLFSSKKVPSKRWVPL